MDKKALDSIGKQPRPGQPECHLLIVVSTQHLFAGNENYDLRKELARHNGEHGVYIDEYEYGWHLILLEDEEPDEPWVTKSMEHIVKYARIIGATHVRLDADGPVVDKIPVVSTAEEWYIL